MRRFIVNNIFVDTNVLIYFSYSESGYNEKAKAKLKELSKENQLFISNQIILEYINTITNERLFKENTITIKQAIANIDLFLSFIKIANSSPEYKDIKDGILDYNLTRAKLFDLNIYLTMLANGINKILTVNKKDFDLFKNIQVLGLE